MNAWTADQLATLRTAWVAGLVAAEIVAKLGPGFTASAVRGKVRRLGWARALDTGGEQAHSIHSRKGMTAAEWWDSDGDRPARLTDWPAMPGPLPGSTPKVWTERDGGQCCWPVGGEGADLVACCLPRARRKSYCPAHFAMAHGGAWNCEAVNDDHAETQGQKIAA